MPSPHTVHASDLDDEPRDVHIDPMSLRRVVEEEEPVEHESSEEEDPGEESEEEPEEEPEEESEETRPTPLNTRPREPSFRTYRPHPNGPLMMFTPRKRVRIPEPFPILIDDPYLPSSSSAGRRLPDPPTHHTVSLLIARADRHEAEIELLQDNLQLLPGSEHFDEMHRDIETFRSDHHSLRDYHERLEGRVAGDTDRIDEMERQMKRFGEQLADFRNMMEEMQVSISHLTRGLPRPRREE